MKLNRLFFVVSIFISCQIPALATWPPTTWIYQLQNINISGLAELGPDVVVIDYSSDGTIDGEWTPENIQHLKNAGITPICYFSIGEAEDYRFYWQEDWTTNPPDWLGPENPDWEGNYKVKYWQQGWKDILFGVQEGDEKSYLDRIIDMGFEGIYLDIVDAYYYWMEEVEFPFENAAVDMAELIEDLAEYARDTRGMGDSFLVIPQNGEFLVYDAPPNNVESYFNVINGIGVEDVFHPGDLDNDNPYDPDTERLEVLEEFTSRSKAVLSVDYLTQLSAIENFYSSAYSEQFIPLATTRDLDAATWYPQFNSVEIERNNLPENLLITNYPNPFNASTNVVLSILKPSTYSVRLYDINGREIATLFNDHLKTGTHRFSLSGSNLPSGFYIVSVKGQEINGYKKIELIK